MASKRMFGLEIVDTDDFLEMPAGARLLYFDLGMRADDHGMLGDAKKIMRFTGAAEDDMKILIAKGYVIPFDSGVIAITHWHTNNQVRPDRVRPSRYINELDELKIVAGVYVKLTADERSKLNDPDLENARLPQIDGQMPGKCQATASNPRANDGQLPAIRGQMPAQNRIDKNSIGEDSIEEHRREGEENSVDERQREAFGRFGALALTPNEAEEVRNMYQNPEKLIAKVDRYLANATRPYDNHLALLIKIAEEDGWPKKKRKQEPDDDPTRGMTMRQIEAMMAERMSL